MPLGRHNHKMLKNLRQIRKSKKITQQELADALCISRTQITKWETGQMDVSLRWVGKLANALGVSVPELLGETEISPPAVSNARMRALLLAEALAQKQPEQVRQKLSAILDQELKTMGEGMTPESFVKFFIESRQIGGEASPVQDKPKKKPSSD